MLAGIVVVSDLTPTRPPRLDPTAVLGIVTAAGSPVSHGAILARALGIPTVVGVGRDLLTVPDGTTIVVDGTDGIVVVDPDTTALDHYRAKADGQRQHASKLLDAAGRPAITADGVPIEVLANIGSRERPRSKLSVAARTASACCAPSSSSSTVRSHPARTNRWRLLRDRLGPR